MAITLDRTLAAPTEAEIIKESVTLAPLLYLDFPSLKKYYSGTNYNIKLTSSAIMPAGIYVGVGGVSRLATVEESTELKSQKLVAELNGLDSTYIALVLAEQYFGRDATLGLATLDTNYKIIGEPIILFKGLISLLTADIQQNFKVTVEIESILSDWERPRIKRWNESNQKDIDATDRGFDSVARAVNKEIVWG